MKKNDINAKLREHVRAKLSPTPADRKFVSDIYESFDKLLNQNCIQIGAYSRFTAIRPLHDLDIIYILGNWDEKNHSPAEALNKLYSKINNGYENPSNYKIVTSLQTHSVTVSFNNVDGKEIFSVDIVPGYIFSKNEFGADMYKVPEVLKEHHGENRTKHYQKLSVEKKEMVWISSDPRGYIEVAKRVNLSNSDFRKAIKFIKAWKNSCKSNDDDFKLKSFHIEQVVTAYFQDNSHMEIFDAIFLFFASLPEIIKTPQIKDRANDDKYIDDYLNDLTRWQKEKIIKARDCFLIKLEEISIDTTIDNLFNTCYYERVSDSEQFLFDFKIPVFLDDNYLFEIYGEAQERKGSFLKKILGKSGLISIDREIKFRIKGNPPNVDCYKWKVKNDNSSPQPRGEITDHQTMRDPEHTKFVGDHFVECYAILNNICVAKARQNVKLERIY